MREGEEGATELAVRVREMNQGGCGDCAARRAKLARIARPPWHKEGARGDEWVMENEGYRVDIDLLNQ